MIFLVAKLGKISSPDISDALKQKILERRTAREQKDWARSDEIRDELLEEGIRLRDSKDKTFWEYL
jgi:cysteinyl-tRNA synthetase